MKKYFLIIVIASLSMLNVGCDNTTIEPDDNSKSIVINGTSIPVDSEWVWESVEQFNTRPTISSPEYGLYTNTGNCRDVHPSAVNGTLRFKFKDVNTLEFYEYQCGQTYNTNLKFRYDSNVNSFFVGENDAREYKILEISANSIKVNFDNGNFVNRNIILRKK
jgi:hypothetical protein